MKELSAAQGVLRCGECGSTFDAMQSLSTTLPEDRKFIKKANLPTIEDKEPQAKQKIYAHSVSNTESTAAEQAKNDTSYQLKRRKKPDSNRFLLIALVSLSCLLAAQIFYKQKDWLATQPLTSGITRIFCEVIPNCEVKKRRDITKIEMLNKNIYSHPNQIGSLVVSASLENQAAFDQPFPLIEISLLDAQSHIIALRRFPPKDYLGNKFQQGLLMVRKNPIDFKLNIADPGDDAIRFQFRFL
jgi:hypothetical protein